MQIWYFFMIFLYDISLWYFFMIFLCFFMTFITQIIDIIRIRIRNFSWYVFSHFKSQHKDLFCKSPNSVQTHKKKDQNNSTRNYGVIRRPFQSVKTKQQSWFHNGQLYFKILKEVVDKLSAWCLISINSNMLLYS